MKIDMSREQFAISCSIVNAVRVASSMYQGKGEESEYSEEEAKKIAEIVKSQCSQMMLQDLGIILDYCID
jgi:hypothetical protein